MKKSNNRGITMIGLILIILIFVVIGVIIVTSILKDKAVQEDIQNQVNSAKAVRIEQNAKEEMILACSAIRFSIAHSMVDNRDYSAIDDSVRIQKSILNLIQNDTYLLKEGWTIGDYATNGDSTFTLVYQGTDYVQATQNSNAKIVFTIQLGIDGSIKIN